MIPVDAKKPLIKFTIPKETRNRRRNLHQHNKGYIPETNSQSKITEDTSCEIRKKTIAPAVSVFIHELNWKSLRCVK